MNKKETLAKNTFVIFLGKFSTQLISLFLLPLYTIYLTPRDFGFVDLIVTYIALFVPVITIQLEMAGFRYLIDARDDEAKKKEVISNVLQIIFGIAGGLGVLYLLIGRFIQIPYEGLILLNILVTVFCEHLFTVCPRPGRQQEVCYCQYAHGYSYINCHRIICCTSARRCRGACSEH